MFAGLENGNRIRLWEIPHLIEAFELANAAFVTTEYCCWGLHAVDGSKAPWQKSTTLAGTLPGLTELGRRRCHGRRRCEITGRLHTPLIGRDQDGNWRTKVAEPYPVELCAAVSDLAAAVTGPGGTAGTAAPH